MQWNVNSGEPQNKNDRISRKTKIVQSENYYTEKKNWV